jgi:hypothetical protein
MQICHAVALERDILLHTPFYPDGPNDLTPPEYHLFEADQSLPYNSITPLEEPSGIGWHS